jgi:SAM-dependent methyltransferase
MTNQNEKRQNISNYNQSATLHSKKFNEIGARTEDIERTFTYIKKSNPKTIEIGCGNGRDAKEIIKHTNDYLGIDLSEGMLNLAKKNVPETNFQLADLESFEFPLSTDTIISFASFLHTDKETLTQVLQKIDASLNTNGVVFISLKYGEYHKETQDKEGTGPRTYYFYTPEEIQQIAPVSLRKVYQNIQDFRGQKWFSIILQKSI